MSYRRVEDAVALVIKKSPSRNFTSNNVAQGHFRFIHSRPFSVVLTPGSISQEMSAPQAIQAEYEIQIRLFHKAIRDRLEDVYRLIVDRRQEIINILNVYPTLDTDAGYVSPDPNVVHETIVSALIESASEPEWEQIQRTYFWTQELSCTVSETILLANTGEYSRGSS